MWIWLVPIGKWLLKLVGGWLPIGTKPVSEWLGKLLWAIGISAAMFFLLIGFRGCGKKEKPITQHLTAGGSITNPTYNLSPRFGCATLILPKEVK